MPDFDFKTADLKLICKNCGYELGVHASAGEFCPDKSQDPYKQKFSLNKQHKFNHKSKFVKEQQS